MPRWQFRATLARCSSHAHGEAIRLQITEKMFNVLNKVLMVAEKPSLARSLAEILSNGTLTTRPSLSQACSVHEYTGTFKGAPARFAFTSVCGHVMSLDFLAKYNNWTAVDPSELFDAPTEKKEANPKLSICRFLRNEGKGVDYLVLWLDCDREGENICFEVMDSVLPVMNKAPHGVQTVYRAHVSPAIVGVI